MSKTYAGFYAKSRKACQRMGRPKDTPFGHCIKSCILNNFRDCEKPSVGTEFHGHETSDNDGLWCDVMLTGNEHDMH